MTIKTSKKMRGVSGDASRAIVKVEDFDGTSAVFNVEFVQYALDAIKKMDIESVEIGVDKETDALLFFMDEERTIAYALAAKGGKDEISGIYKNENNRSD